MSRFTKRAACFLAAVCAFIFSAVGYFDVTLPDSFYVSGDDLPQIGSALSLSVFIDSAAPAVSDGDIDSEASVMLFGAIPIKKAEIKHTKTPYLVPGGSPIGIKLLTDGVVVVATEDSSGRKGPAADAGIEAGDTIISANGEVLSSSNRLAEIIMNSHGEKISLLVRRDGKEFPASVTPEFSDSEGTYKAGLWIKDSSAGVGTLTYTDPSSGSFGALGHPISDGDTGKILPLGSGEIVDVTVTGCDKGRPGRPGELIGTFLSGLACGTIKKNCEQGIFGRLNYFGASREPIPIAFKTEIEPGPAVILATVDGSTPKEYSVNIEKVALVSQDTKNMVIKVTDPELLRATGGIVQGMSGSPIIQNGKLCGAVTHVFVSDPSMGYGIFIENMLIEGKILER